MMCLEFGMGIRAQRLKPKNEPRAVKHDARDLYKAWGPPPVHFSLVSTQPRLLFNCSPLQSRLHPAKTPLHLQP